MSNASGVVSKQLLDNMHGTPAYLVHPHIHGVLRFSVDLKLDFWGGQLKGTCTSTRCPPLLGIRIHLPEPLAELICHAGVIYARLGLRIGECSPRSAADNELSLDLSMM